MGKAVGKQTQTTFSMFLTCAGLLAVVLVVDFLWASSSNSSSADPSIASNWALEKSETIILPDVTTKAEKISVTSAII